MMHQSIATIDSPEFINLQPLEINPLMSSCEIKVLYVGENRNRSYISKDVARDMAKTLRGAPIVGYYKEEKEDFRDHGQQIIFDDEGVKFECLTKPYGFVAPDAKVWFQKFEEKDDFGNSITREYLMTTGYLWTGQYEEAELAVKQGRPQSMELDEDTLDGRWSVNNKTGMEFFIINDAIFSKLCILGEDVEPCFEGASVTAPEVSKNFSLDDNFKRTLFTMMQDLKFALEGGKNMEIVVENTEEIVTEETVVENIETAVEAEEVATEEESVEETPATEFDSLKRAEKVVEAPAAVEETEEKVEEQPEEEVAPVEEEISEPEVTEEEVVEEIPAEDDNSEQSIEVESEEVIEATQSSQENFAKSEEDKKEEEAEEEDSESESEDDKEEEDEKKKYSLLEAELEKANTAYAELEEKYNALVEFKNAVENKEKEELINSFYMLSDEDKKDVIENKAKYSLEEIESKLSVICYRKKVSFESNEVETKNNDTQDVTTYNLNTVESTPAWVKALKNTQKSRNI